MRGGNPQGVRRSPGPFVNSSPVIELQLTPDDAIALVEISGAVTESLLEQVDRFVALGEEEPGALPTQFEDGQIWWVASFATASYLGQVTGVDVYRDLLGRDSPFVVLLEPVRGSMARAVM